MMALPALRAAGLLHLAALCLALLLPAAPAGAQERAVDIPTRNTTQRILLLEAAAAHGVVVLFPGGDGGMQLGADGAIGQLRGNFLVRTRQQFAAQGLHVALIDAPADRQSRPFLSGFRQGAEHAEDVRQVIRWLRAQYRLPVWLAGTSRGTQSVAAAAVRLAGEPDSPDGIVLTSSILLGNDGSRPLPAMALEKLALPVLVVHHEDDACRICPYREVPALMSKLAHLPRKALQTARGGISRGDPCEALAYHGYNGIEAQVVGDIVKWIRESTP